jgi:stearoyl-CoA desaturase (delta-9 desaturase)
VPTAAQRIADVRTRLDGVRGVTVPDERLFKLQRRAMLAISILPLVGIAFAIVQLWGWGVTARDLVIAGGFYVVTGLGITVGYHRLLTHKSFDVPNWVRVGWAIAGSLAVQGSAIDWVATHRRHHAYSDEEGDPHSPHLDAADGVRGILRGLWHAHLGWMFAPDGTDAETWAPDLLDNDAIVKVNRAFPWLILATFALPALIGGLWSMSLMGAVTAAVWAGLLRMFLLHHVTWSINSICHFYGTRPFHSRDEARNNIWLSLLSFGESWHNAHHAFPASARHGLRWWEFDLSWLTIRTMKAVGLARNIKLPSPSQMARKKLPRRAAAGA